MDNTWSSAGTCESYLLFHVETTLGNGMRSFIYLLGLAYCFIGLSAITARFFRSMETIVKQTETVIVVDPHSKLEVAKKVKIWNYTIADITLLAFGTSFPQISLAIIDAIQNLGTEFAGGLGPGTLVGSAAFDLFPIHAVCVVVPRAGTVKKISDIGVWLVELFWSFWAYVWLYIILEVWTPNMITLWEALLTVLQFGLLLLHAYAQDKRLPYFSLPTTEGKRPEEWVPEEPTFGSGNEGSAESSEIFEISEDREQRIVDIFSIHSKNENGINAYVIAFTALASGTSWPDLVASKIAAERQVTADSAIANITCSNSVNIYIGIGIPWLINTSYNLFVKKEPLYINNAEGLSFSLIVFFATSVCCISVLVLRRLALGGELGGPRPLAWATCFFFLFLWFVFVLLSSLKVSGII